jgi:hypothetical protein
VHLHVPMLSVPIQGQYEQELNARYLQRLGYGMFSEEMNGDVISDFLKKTPEMQEALKSYKSRDNRVLFDCIDELLRDVQLAEPAPQRLQTKALGAWEGPDLPQHLLDAIELDEDETVTAGKKT